MSRTCPFSPPPDYAGLREHPGLPRLTGPSGRTVFVAARHDDVRTVSLIEMDPPEHGPARRAVAGEFTIRRMGELRPEVQCSVDGLLDDELRYVNGSAFSVSALPATW
ncbi:hypothetical protein [Streptomyces roseoverticillatus]|uniref:Uncharacterized protein n=1 Tax=Streptomyces roseoverticillatus TaxID=66429 RepID=A0ABV3J2T5_9ACTN